MSLQKKSYAGCPEAIALEKFGCIAIELGARGRPSPLRSAALQWIDWHLQGQISRYLLSPRSHGDKTTFVPTMNRLPTPYLALLPAGGPQGAADGRDLWAACEGLQIRRVLYFCEDGVTLREAEGKIRKRPPSALPEEIILGSDA